MPDIFIGVFDFFLSFGKDKKKTRKKKYSVMSININVTNKTNTLIIAIYSTYSVLSQLPIHNALYVPLAINLIGMMKHRRFLMRVLRSNLCKCHSLNTSYHSNT